MRITNYVFGFIFFVLISCTKDDDNKDGEENQSYRPGVVITLDDDYVDNWADAHEILQEYQWKATFFITKCNQLSSEEIARLQQFKQYGHEIGGHGLNHLNAPQQVAANAAEGYLNTEIYPMIGFMNGVSLPVTSFAYPFGARNETTDAVLLRQFSILRGTTYGSPGAIYQNCYYTGRRVVYGLGIDKSYSHFNEQYFLSLLQYAKENNKIVVFYAHKTVAAAHNDYETEYNTLIEICRFVQNNNMKFYTMSELTDLPL